MRKNKVELLAPAGTRESLIGAINAGADAIYLSGKNYGARKYANNFTKEEIAELIEYAHTRSVKVYVTVNTLIFEDEISELLEYSDFLVSNNVDALIVQDIGILNTFVKRYPDTEIHASTQMNAFNIEQVQWLESLGVDRIILARETSIDTINAIRDLTDVDLEVFVHGALCVSYSGNCLFSSMNGGRSGNRGECAQPCRLKYRLTKNGDTIEEESYLLSAKDLMTIDNLERIVDSGVKSLKIEGRMRRPEYVVATVRAYREALDSIETGSSFDFDQRITELLSVFNRDYTKGYILDEDPYRINNSKRPNHLGLPVGKVLTYSRGKATIKLTGELCVGDGIRIIDESDTGGAVSRILKDGSSVTSAQADDIVTIDLPSVVSPGSEVMRTMDKRFEEGLGIYLNENYDLIGIDIRIIAKIGDRLRIEAQTEKNISVAFDTEYIVEKSLKQSQSTERITEQFKKFGNTCYHISSMEIEADDSIFIPNGVINEARRSIVELIKKSALERPTARISTISDSLNFITKRQPGIVVKVETFEQLFAAKNMGVEIIYYSERLGLGEKNDFNIEPFKLMNRVWTDLDRYSADERLVIRDYGALKLARSKTVVADWTFNVTNSLSLETLYENGVSRVALSPECSMENSRKLIEGFKSRHGRIPATEQVVYGKTDLMLTKYCPITKSEGVFRQNCNLCERNEYHLINERNDVFRLVRDGFCNLRILHSKPLNLIDYLDDIVNAGIETFRLDFTDEDESTTEMVIKAFQNRLEHKPHEMPKRFYTYGRFLK